MTHMIWVISYESYNMFNISPKVTCGPKRRLPDGQMRTEEYKSSIWRRWSSRTFSTAAITLLNCRSLAEFISLNRLFSEGSRLKKITIISHPYIYKIGYQFLFLQWLHFTTLLSQPKNRIGSGYEALHHHRIAKTKSWTLQKVVSNYLHRNLSNFFSIRNILF